MNDLVYVMYNLKFKSTQIREIVALPFDEIQSNDEWITKEADDVVEIEQVEGEIDVQNVSLDGPTTYPILNTLDLDNITFDVDDAHVSSREELDEDDDGDNDIIRG